MVELDGIEKVGILVKMTKTKKFQVFVISFLLSFVAQFIYVQIDYNKVLQNAVWFQILWYIW